MNMNRIVVEGINSVEGKKAFVEAVEIFGTISGNPSVALYEPYYGTVQALSYVFEYGDNEELIEDIANLFNRYNCQFEASWNEDSYDSNYRAKIDIDRMPISICKEIVKQAKCLEKRLRKQAVADVIAKLKQERASAKEVAKERRKAEQKEIEKLKKYRNGQNKIL